MKVFHDLVIGGVFVAPIVSYAALGLIIVIALRPLLHLAGASRFFSSVPVAELSLYVTIVGLLTLYF